MAHNGRNNRTNPNHGNGDDHLIVLLTEILQQFQFMEEFDEQKMNEMLDDVEHLLASGQADPLITMNRTLPGQWGSCAMDDLFRYMERRSMNDLTLHIARALYESIIHYYPLDKINALNPNGQTMLLMAIQNNAPIDVVQDLIHRGSDVDLPDENGSTPLHYASVQRYPDFVHLLLENGAEKHLKDKNGKTPLYYVRNQYKVAPPHERPIVEEILELLEERNVSGSVLNNTSTPNNNNNQYSNNNMDGGKRRSRKGKSRRVKHHKKGKTRRRR